ncbi:MAG: EpsI family protein [bacterium]|nr:EpsI family protein [bacterium]
MTRIHVYFLVIAILLMGATAVSRARPEVEPVPPSRSFDLFPQRIGDWTGREHPFDPEILEVLGADDYLNRSYRNAAGESLAFYLGFYRSQKRGDQIHSPLHCYPGGGWNPVSREVVPVSIGETSIHINRLTIRKGDNRRVVAYWYQAQDKAMANEYGQRIHLVMTAIGKNRTDGALIRVSMPFEAGQQDATWNTMGRFIEQIYPLLGDYLPQ